MEKHKEKKASKEVTFDSVTVTLYHKEDKDEIKEKKSEKDKLSDRLRFRQRILDFEKLFGKFCLNSQKPFRQEGKEEREAEESGKGREEIIYAGSENKTKTSKENKDRKQEKKKKKKISVHSK